MSENITTSFTNRTAWVSARGAILLYLKEKAIYMYSFGVEIIFLLMLNFGSYILYILSTSDAPLLLRVKTLEIRVGFGESFARFYSLECAGADALFELHLKAAIFGGGNKS